MMSVTARRPQPVAEEDAQAVLDPGRGACVDVLVRHRITKRTHPSNWRLEQS